MEDKVVKDEGKYTNETNEDREKKYGGKTKNGGRENCVDGGSR